MTTQVSRNADFRLVGHDCLYGSYPAPVIPVCEQPDGRLASIYPGGTAAPTPQPIDDDANYVVHGKTLSKSLARFDWRSDRLFAFDRDEVVGYPADGEWTFLTELFSNPRFAVADPFVRLMLAKHTRMRRLILPEIAACYAELKATDPDSAGTWHANELVTLPDEVLVALPEGMADSPVAKLVMREILKTENLGPSFSLPECGEATGNEGAAAQIRAAKVLVVIRGLERGAVGGGSNGIYYRMGIAAALERPILLLTTSAHQIPAEIRCDIVIEYAPLDVGDPGERLRLAERIASALSDLGAGAVKGRSAQLGARRDSREQLRRLYSFASGIQGEGNVLIPAVGRVFQIACGPPIAKPGADFRCAWDEFQRLHSNRMAPYVNGAAARTGESLARLLRSVDAVQQGFNGLESPFKGLRTHLKSYEDAYESATRYVGSSGTDKPHLFAVIDPVEQTLQNVTNHAARLMEALVKVMLPPDPASVRDADA